MSWSSIPAIDDLDSVVALLIMPGAREYFLELGERAHGHTEVIQWHASSNRFATHDVYKLIDTVALQTPDELGRP